MLKKIMLVLVFLLAGCGLSPAPLPTPTFISLPSLPPPPSLTPAPSPSPTRTPIVTHAFRDGDPAAIQVFKTSENCPNVCWRGIHAGTTSVGQAFTLLRNSKEVGSVEMFDDYILGTFGVIRFLDGVVTSIELTKGFSIHITVGDFMSLMGEPDGVINFDRECFLFVTNPTSWECTDFRLYYSKLSAIVFFHPPRGVNPDPGPSPKDSVVGLTVGIPVGSDQNYLGPWLGYGHLKEYSLNPAPIFTPYPLS